MGYNIVGCSVERCVHNMNNACGAQYIHVVNNTSQDIHKTNCHTFELRNFRTTITNVTNINIEGVVDQIFTEEPVMNPTIRCTVENCIYNSNNTQCTADEIDVKGTSSSTIQQTECGTFRAR